MIRVVMPAVLVALSAAALAADSVQLTAGRWEEKMTVQSASLDGKPLSPDALGTAEASFTCIPAAEAADPSLYFKKSQASEGCGMPQGVVEGGRISLSGSCNPPGSGAMSLRLEGTYAGTAYRGTATATMVAQGKPLVVTTVIEGRHVGSCTGDESN